MFIPSPSYNGSVPTRYQPMCQGHQVSTSACSPDPILPQHPSFPTKLPGVHLLWTHSNVSGQAVESPCLAKLLQSDDSDTLLLCSHHCCWDQTTSQAAQVSVSNLLRKGKGEWGKEKPYVCVCVCVCVYTFFTILTNFNFKKYILIFFSSQGKKLKSSSRTPI